MVTHDLTRPGLMIIGDAAGFTLNTGLTIRGMDLATGSALAAGLWPAVDGLVQRPARRQLCQQGHGDLREGSGLPGASGHIQGLRQAWR